MAVKTLIERIELSSSAASITFSDIPQTYTDLLLVASLRDTGDVGTAFAYIQFNDATTGYTSRLLRGSGSSTSSTSNSDGTSLRGRISPNDATANTFGSTAFYIPNYTSSNYKSVSIDSVQEENNTESWQTITAGLWSNTSAITSIKIFAGNSNLAQYSSAALYAYTKGTDGTTTVS
jgi:hypothetical protein